ncbi:hypothetical protein [Taklimakanibacter lacteus]|uniref:hypothetical protein n=1 Tax=Taklimakanibacter lacteus TaxID=2268456 RepID=UPI000E672CF6
MHIAARYQALSVIFLATGLIPANAQGIDLSTGWQPQPQTDEQRLETFTVPPDPAPSYPRLGSDRGETRLQLDPSHSIGGNFSGGGIEGNYRFPIPGQ